MNQRQLRAETELTEGIFRTESKLLWAFPADTELPQALPKVALELTQAEHVAAVFLVNEHLFLAS
jgi:hypothetical protein